MAEDARKSFTEGKKLVLLLRGSILNPSRQIHLFILFLGQQLFILKKWFLVTSWDEEYPVLVLVFRKQRKMSEVNLAHSGSY